MDDKRIDELINEALREDMALPDGLAERLERRLDSLASRADAEAGAPRVSIRAREGRSPRRRFLYALSGVAAALIGVVCYIGIESARPAKADTFTDPREAALVAQDALALLLRNLNKGLEQAREANREITRIQDIVNKHLND